MCKFKIKDHMVIDTETGESYNRDEALVKLMNIIYTISYSENTSLKVQNGLLNNYRQDYQILKQKYDELKEFTDIILSEIIENRHEYYEGLYNYMLRVIKEKELLPILYGHLEHSDCANYYEILHDEYECGDGHWYYTTGCHRYGDIEDSCICEKFEDKYK